MPAKKQISVLNYTDYREYLEDYYTWQKSVNKVFSYRYFAKNAGYSSSGFYKDIVSGRSNINTSMIRKFSKAIKHSKSDEEYFEILVLYNQSNVPDDQNKYFERLQRFYTSKAFLVESDKYEFYSKWYYTAIRDLLNLVNFKKDYAFLARSLDPKIRPEQAKKAFSLLIKFKMIKKNKSGYYKPTDNIISTGKVIHSLNVKNFQSQMMDIAKKSLGKHSKAERNITTVSFGVGEDTYKLIEAEIKSCRKRILNMVENSKNENRLYQLNFQLFPISKVIG